MRQIALALESDVSVYGLRSRGVPGVEDAATVEAMAGFYVEAVVEAQPWGPLMIAGHSFGGLVAFELARLLRERGRQVAWLGMIDAELSTAALPPARRWGRRLALPFHLARAGVRRPGDATPTLIGEMLPDLLRRIRRRLRPRSDDAEPGTGLAGLPAEDRRLGARYLRAAAAFRPRRYPGGITYFLPEERRLHLYADPLPAWRRVADGGVEVEPVPGPHVGMVSGRSGQVVAEGIDAHISRRSLVKTACEWEG